MIKKIWFAVFVSIYFSCETKQNDSRANVSSNPCHGMVNLEKWTHEVLEVDSLLVNGNLPFTSKINTYINFFGKPHFTAIIPTTEGFLNYINPNSLEYGKRYYYGQSVVEAVGETAVIQKLQLNGPVKFLSHPLVHLTKDTNVRELMKNFPESCKLISNPGNGHIGIIILRASKFDLDPRRVVLSFNGEWLDCIEICTFR